MTWESPESLCLAFKTVKQLIIFFKDLHSGVFGGSVHEGMADLIYMMNTLLDKDGKILVDGLMDEVAPVTPGIYRRWNLDMHINLFWWKFVISI